MATENSRRTGGRAGLKKLWAIAALALATVAAPGRSEAVVSVVDAFLFSDWSEPTDNSSPPFTFVGTDGVKLTLNGSGVATAADDVTSDVSLTFIQALTYVSHTGTIDSGEAGPIGPHVDSEVGTLDDVGVTNIGADTNLNLDYGDNAAVIFNSIPIEGITRLMIGEDAGLDPFKLELCDNATCTGTVITLFNGFDPDTKNDILARADFDACDEAVTQGCAIDQVYLFVFSEPATGYLRLTETDDYFPATADRPLNERLEIDFIGIAVPGVIPEPASLLLFGIGGLGALAARRHGRRSRA
jgi:hypothetical protein